MKDTSSEPRIAGLGPLPVLPDLPLAATYHPAGFSLELTTNSPDVLEAADESWGLWAATHIRGPLGLHVVVSAGGGLAARPSFRRYERLLCVVSDSDNFAVADLDALDACIFVSQRTATDHAWMRWFFLDAVAYVLLAQRYTVPVHAACVANHDSAVLLCGRSGAGKTTLSFACARAGWTFLSDDGTWLLPDQNESLAVGRPFHARFRPDATRWFPELERFSECVRPDGKVFLEVPLAQFPEIRTADQSRVGCLVWLDRRPGFAAELKPVPPVNVVDRMLEEIGRYGEEVDRRSQQTLHRLVQLPAYRLRYDRLEHGVELLSGLEFLI
jgi:hypothetical protein